MSLLKYFEFKFWELFVGHILSLSELKPVLNDRQPPVLFCFLKSHYINFREFPPLWNHHYEILSINANYIKVSWLIAGQYICKIKKLKTGFHSTVVTSVSCIVKNLLKFGDLAVWTSIYSKWQDNVHIIIFQIKLPALLSNVEWDMLNVPSLNMYIN